MNFYTLSQTSLAKSGSSVVEEYIPLWMADGTSANNSTAVFYLIEDGSTATVSTGSPPSAAKLHTLNPNWSSNQKYALEFTAWNANGTGGIVALWDITSGGVVTASQVSIGAASSATVFRSAQFTLISGHSYGVATQGASNNALSLTDASLIVFGS